MYVVFLDRKYKLRLVLINFVPMTSGFPASSDRRFQTTSNPIKFTHVNCLINSLRPITRICVSKLSIIGSDKGLSPGRHQAIIWTKAGISLIRNLGTNFSEIVSEMFTLSFKKMRLKTSSVKWRPCYLGLNVHKDIRRMYSFWTNMFVNLLKLNYPQTRWQTFWQMTFSNAFSWMKILEFRFKFHWNLFLRVKSTISQHWFR